MDIKSQEETYHGFIRGSIALVIACVYVLVALCTFAFGKTAVLLIGFGGLILGLFALIIDLRTGTKTWALSLGLLAIFALISGMNVS